MVEVAPLAAIDLLFSDATPPDPFPQLLADAQVRFELASS
jgi:DeoR family glycerol-3-phosphate regulon repressor